MYSHIYAKPSLAQTTFDQVQKDYTYPEAEKTIHVILDIVNQVRKLKSNAHIALRTELTDLTMLSSENKLENMLNSHTQLIKGVTRAQEIFYKDTKIDDTLETKLESIENRDDNKYYAIIRTNK